MPFEITNTLRGSSIVRAVDAGTYTITLNDLRANTTTESVTAADIRHVKWSTNGNIRIVRNSIPLLALHSGGAMEFDDYGHSIANNAAQHCLHMTHPSVRAITGSAGKGIGQQRGFHDRANYVAQGVLH